MKLILSILDDTFTIHRLPPASDLPQEIWQAEFYSVSKTDEEISIVCSAHLSLPSETQETGWSCIKVLGPLDFSLTGILAMLAATLAAAEISIFALSTFDTDYLLVKTHTLPAARSALENAGHSFKD